MILDFFQVKKTFVRERFTSRMIHLGKFILMLLGSSKMTSAQVVETSITFHNYLHPDDHTMRTTDTPWLKPITMYGNGATLLVFKVFEYGRTDSYALTKIFQIDGLPKFPRYGPPLARLWWLRYHI